MRKSFPSAIGLPMEVGCIRPIFAVRMVVLYAAIMVIIFAFQPPVWCMLVIGWLQNYGLITVEATTGSHSNIRGSTRTLFGLYHVSNGLSYVFQGSRMMLLLYGPSSLTMLPISPTNERRESDQYAESREDLSADGKHCRMSGTVRDGFNGF